MELTGTGGGMGRRPRYFGAEHHHACDSPVSLDNRTLNYQDPFLDHYPEPRLHPGRGMDAADAAQYVVHGSSPCRQALE